MQGEYHHYTASDLFLHVAAAMARSSTSAHLTHCVSALIAIVPVAITVCGHYVAPPTVPPVTRIDLRPLQAALSAYLDQTQAYRKNAAARAESIPDQATSPTDAKDAVRTQEHEMANAIRTQVRPMPRAGDIFAFQTAAILQRDVAAAFCGSRCIDRTSPDQQPTTLT